MAHLPPHQKKKGILDELDTTQNVQNTQNDAPFQNDLPMCKYGWKCYRKNPNHFKKFRHPSDPVNSEEKAPDQNAYGFPMCKYGKDCKRRNSAHFKNFDHPSAKCVIYDESDEWEIPSDFEDETPEDETPEEEKDSNSFGYGSKNSFGYSNKNLMHYINKARIREAAETLSQQPFSESSTLFSQASSKDLIDAEKSLENIINEGLEGELSTFIQNFQCHNRDNDKFGDDGNMFSRCSEAHTKLEIILLYKNLSEPLVSLVGAGIGDKEALFLCKCLKRNTTAKTLELNDNEIGPAGFLALAKAVKYRKTKIVITIGAKQNYQELQGIRMGMLLYDIKDLTKIASGNFGSAYKGFIMHLGYCVFKVAQNKESNESLYESLLMSYLPRHKNVLKLIGLNEDFEIDGQQHVAYVVEFHRRGSLENFLDHNKEVMTASRVLQFCEGMASSVDHLHRYGLLHRDIAPRNYVVDENYDAVMIDFGLSCGIEEANEVRGIFPLESAPEYYNSGHISEASDVWLLGVTYAELIGGTLPIYQNATEHLGYLHNTKHSPAGPFHWPRGQIKAEFKQLILQCCAFDTRKRLAIPDILHRIAAFGQNDVFCVSPSTPSTPGQTAVPDGYSDESGRMSGSLLYRDETGAVVQYSSTY